MDKIVKLDIPSSIHIDRKDPRNDELSWLHTTLKSLPSKRILSIGGGVSTYIINKTLNPDVLVVVEVDEKKIETVEKNVPNAILLKNWRYSDHGPFDLIFIDSSAGCDKPGLHRDEAILNAEESMSKDALIVIHDYNAKIGEGSRTYLESNNYELIAFNNIRKGFGIYRKSGEITLEDDSSFTSDYSNVTVVTACDKNHLSRLEISLPTWIEVKGLTCPIIVFSDGFEDTKLSKYENVKFIKWDIAGAHTQREKMLSSFIFGVSDHVKTDYWLKLDSDTIATNDEQFLKESFFLQDMVGQPWSYTKPGSMVPRTDFWLEGLEKIGKIKGFKGTDKKYLLHGDDYSKPDKLKHKSGRVISYVRFTKTELIKELRELIIWDRMPIQSEDTLVWRYCDRMSKAWSRFKFSHRGWKHSKRNMKEIADKSLTSIKG